MTGAAANLPPLGRRFVKYVLGFGVGVAVGLASFLGKVRVPGFISLLELYPASMQTTLIAMSGILLGAVALAVQFYSMRSSSALLLGRYFRSGLISMLVAFVLLLALYKSFVRAIPDGRGGSIAVVIGFRSHNDNCRCPQTMDDVTCITKRLTLDPADIGSCWDHLPLVELALMIPYLYLLGGFGALVGLLLLREEEGQRRGKQGRSASARKTGRPPVSRHRGPPPPAP